MARQSNNTALNALVSSLGSDFAQLMVKKTITFTGAAGFGASGDTVDICSVSGVVELAIIPVCTTNLVSAGGGKFTLGTASDVDAIIGLTTATDIDAGLIWQSTTPIDCPATSTIKRFVTGSNIAIDVTVANVTAGVIDFYIFYRPISTGATVS